MLEIKKSSVFKSDVKKIKGEQVLDDVRLILTLLIDEKELPQKYRPHSLVGNYKGYMECHIRPDLLLIYRVIDGSLYLYRIGSHSNLFK